MCVYFSTYLSALISVNLLDFFSKLSDLDIKFVDFGSVKPDIYRSTLFIDTFPVLNCAKSLIIPTVNLRR